MSIKKYRLLIENVEESLLTEAIRFSNKEKNLILNNSSIVLGVEYEFHPNDMAAFENNTDDEDSQFWWVAFTTFQPEVIDDETNIEELVDDNIFSIDDVLVYDGNSYEFHEIERGESSSPLEYEEIRDVILYIIFKNNRGSLIKEGNYLSKEFESIVEYILEFLENEDITLDDTMDMRSDLVKETIRTFGLVTNDTTHRELITALYNLLSSTLWYSIIDRGLMNSIVDNISKILLEPEDYSNLSNFFESLYDQVSDEDFWENNRYNDSDNDLLFISIVENSSAKENITVLRPEPHSDISDMEHIDRIEKEHDSQIEIITHRMSLPDGLKNIQEIFTIIKEQGYTDDKSGLHISISISTKQNMLDAEKFLILLNVDRVHKVFPERNNMVKNFNNMVKDSISKNSRVINAMVRGKFNNYRTLANNIFEIIDISGIALEKYQSVNLRDYDDYDGRIELRYFGGEEYEERYEEVELEILRAAYLLDISHGDLFEKEYKKYRYIYLDKMFIAAFDMSIPSVYKSVNDFFSANDEYQEQLLKDNTWKVNGIPVSDALKDILKRMV